MKALQKFIHLSLVLALLLGSSGFGLKMTQCASGKKGAEFSLFGESSCCCGKKANEAPEPCADLSCPMQRGFTTQTTFAAAAQQVAKLTQKKSDAPRFYSPAPLVEAKEIWAEVSPPPVSGRFLGILYQTFLI